MTIPNTTTHLHCQKCGAAWLKTDPHGRFKLSSTSHPVGSYVTPAQIEASAELILTCPFDFDAKAEIAFRKGDSRTDDGIHEGTGDGGTTVKTEP